jgi:predicted transcriptional regulator
MNSTVNVLRIGIASRDQMRDRTLAIARGEYKPGADEPKVWFTSLESLAQVLSTKNQLLLELIRKSRPASLRELATISGRKASNLSRTLHTMERYKLVSLRSEDGRIVPEVLYDRLAFELPIAVNDTESPRERAYA